MSNFIATGYVLTALGDEISNYLIHTFMIRAQGNEIEKIFKAYYECTIMCLKLYKQVGLLRNTTKDMNTHFFGYA